MDYVVGFIENIKVKEQKANEDKESEEFMKAE